MIRVVCSSWESASGEAQHRVCAHILPGRFESCVHTQYLATARTATRYHTASFLLPSYKNVLFPFLAFFFFLSHFPAVTFSPVSLGSSSHRPVSWFCSTASLCRIWTGTQRYEELFSNWTESLGNEERATICCRSKTCQFESELLWKL